MEIGERAAVVSVEARDPAVIRIPAEKQIEVAVIIVIAPRGKPEVRPGEVYARVREDAVSFIAPEVGHEAATGSGSADEDVEVAVVVVVRPCHGSEIAVWKGMRDRGKYAIPVVVVQPGDGYAIRACTGNAVYKQVESAISIIIAPCDTAGENRGETASNGSEVRSVVPIDKHGWNSGTGEPGECKVHSAIVVEITPSCRSTGKAGEDNSAVDQS